MVTLPVDKMLEGLPLSAQNKVYTTLDNVGILLGMKNPKVALSMAPSAVRGLVLEKGQRGDSVALKANHSTYFSLSYGTDFTEMYELYRRAVSNQWDGEADLPWDTQVDIDDPEHVVVSRDFVPFDIIESFGIKLTPKEERQFTWDFAAWTLSQFMHGEQGALYASAQTTECIEWVDGKLYGATQVMDEGRHLEVFMRYLQTKMEKTYHINDNLFVLIDALMTDSRWDFKFLGMQIMVEGLALGAFTTLYQTTREPLLKQMLKMVIQDEARHVHYGVLALRDHIKTLSERERREREDWVYEVSILMRNRFKAHEIYEEWFSHKFPLRAWDHATQNAPSTLGFRRIMFERLIPNLEYIGLMSDRIKEHYDRAGLTQYLGGMNATQIDEATLLAMAEGTPESELAARHDDEMPEELREVAAESAKNGKKKAAAKPAK